MRLDDALHHREPEAGSLARSGGVKEAPDLALLRLADAWAVVGDDEPPAVAGARGAPHAARAGRAPREELTGSTITITSLGALGGIVTTPVINRPEVAIVGVNRIVDRPVIKDGAMVARKMMNLSSSFDHRVIDGMVAAQFVQAIRGYLEFPATLFVE